jgi:hypothetical protein
MMLNRTVPLTIAIAISVSAPTLASSPAFLEASGVSERSSMWGIADGKPATTWCTPVDGSGAAMAVVFDDSSKITHLSLVIGAVPGEDLDRTSARARVVYVSDGGNRVEAKFKDIAQRQVLELTPPLKGRRILVEFAENYPGVKEESPLCIGELGLREGNRELLPASFAQRGMSLSASSQKLLHQWHDDISAPTKTLLLLADGTFRFSSTPVMGDAKAVKMRGKWTATATALILDTGSKRVSLPARLSVIDQGEGSAEELTVEGDGLNKALTGTYRPAPLRFP